MEEIQNKKKDLKAYIKPLDFIKNLPSVYSSDLSHAPSRNPILEHKLNFEQNKKEIQFVWILGLTQIIKNRNSL